MKFKLRFPKSQVERWANRYAYSDGDALPLKVAPAPKKRGYFKKSEFVALTTWKSPRTQKHCKSNPAEFIRSVTETALSTKDERLRIEVLTLLAGVKWPTASVILHFCASEPYPILDYRALWSLSCAVPDEGYKFDLWRSYCEVTRELAASLGVSMRVLDRALWQYSKDNQPGGA